MANVHYFLKIDGIEGESEDDKHQKEIELKGFSFQESQKSAGEGGGGQTAGRVKMGDLVVRTEASKASPLLYLHCANGKQVGQATLTCNKPTGDGGQDWYLKWTLEEVLISDYKQVASESAGPLLPIEGLIGQAIIPVEEVHLSYRSLKLEYRPQQPDGTFGPAVTGCWDRKANKAC